MIFISIVIFIFLLMIFRMLKKEAQETEMMEYELLKDMTPEERTQYFILKDQFIDKMYRWERRNRRLGMLHSHSWNSWDFWDDDYF